MQGLRRTAPLEKVSKDALRTSITPEAPAGTSGRRKVMAGSRIVFVGNLAWTTTEGALQVFASAGGNVVAVELKQHADTGRSKGWGLITYASAEGALEAIRKLDGQELDGRPLHLRLDRSRINEVGVTVFVGNLPWSTTSEDLREIFQPFNPVDVHIKTNMAGRSRGFAQVIFRIQEEAEHAISELSGMELGGRAIEVRLDRMHDESSTGNGYVLVGNLPWSATEQELLDCFAVAGEIVEVEVQRHKDTGKSKGNAIVTYDSQAKAINAVDVLGSLKLGDRPLRAKIYMPGAGKTRRENQETHIAQIY